jgi:hypothetical protein
MTTTDKKLSIEIIERNKLTIKKHSQKPRHDKIRVFALSGASQRLQKKTK